MALPKINGTPKFIMNIPSTGKQVRYRPYLVKEEKVLILAFESGDKVQTLNAVVDTIASCLEDGHGVDINKLTTFDVEYMFTQIRSKSVGEVAQLRVKCTECDTFNDQEVDLETITVDVPKASVIKITDDISIKMKYPPYVELIKKDIQSGNQVELGFEMIRECMESIMTDEENFLVKDHDPKDLEEFIESLTSEQFEKMTNFLAEIPTMKKELNFKCVSCGHDNHVMLEGMSDFF